MYIGLRSTVLYRRELGYVFADDGLRVFRIEEADFDRLRPVDVAPGVSPHALDGVSGGASGDASALSETLAEALLQRFPSLFQHCASREEAEVSFREQEY